MRKIKYTAIIYLDLSGNTCDYIPSSFFSSEYSRLDLDFFQGDATPLFCPFQSFFAIAMAYKCFIEERTEYYGLVNMKENEVSIEYLTTVLTHILQIFTKIRNVVRF